MNNMKQIAFALLALLAIGCQDPRNPSAQSNPTDSAPPNSGIHQPASGTQTHSSSLGFQFAYPKEYVVDSSPDNPLSQPGNSTPGVIQSWQIWKKSDYEAIQTHNFAGSEFPPHISIEVLDNPDRLPLSAWKGDLSRDDDRPFTVAGQKAIAYRATGLYEYDKVLLNPPNGRYVIRLSVGYIDPSDPMRQDFQAIVSSFTFDDPL